METQEDVFLNGEGDRWFERNIFKIEANADKDPVIAAIKQLDFLPKSVAEIGCSNGWRLNEIKKLISANPMEVHAPGLCQGVDPSKTAIANGNARFPGVCLDRGTATAFPWPSNSVDVLIYGFCLYVCDPEDLFEIVTQGNRVLRDEGVLIIHDFDPEYIHAVPNKHVDGLRTFKMDYSQLWTSHPAYRVLRKNALPDGTAVTVLVKNMAMAFPLREED